MRYDKPFYFVTEAEEVYDYDTGNYTLAEPTKERAWALAMPTSDRRQEMLYGAFKQTALTLLTQTDYTNQFEFIEVEGNRFRVDNKRTFKRDVAWEVSGIQ